jgi:hypothetical protein
LSYDSGSKDFENHEVVSWEQIHALIKNHEWIEFSELESDEAKTFGLSNELMPYRQGFWTLEEDPYVLIKLDQNYRVFGPQNSSLKEYYLSVMQKKKWSFRGAGWKGYTAVQSFLSHHKLNPETPTKNRKLGPSRQVLPPDPRRIIYD